MKKTNYLLTIACGLISVTPAFAECPASMPKPLFEDCIVVEGAGKQFPPSGYACMRQYREWQQQQKTGTKSSRAMVRRGTR